MSLSRRALSGAAAPALFAPNLVRAASQTTLRFIPVIDLAFIDPIYAGAQVSRNHGFMVYDTFEQAPFLPLGEYKQPTAYRTAITGILDGAAVFWNVRPA